MSLQSAPRRADGDDEFVEAAVDDVAEEVVDHGELDHATRRLLLKLLNGPYLRAEEHSRLWAALERNEATVRARLGTGTTTSKSTSVPACPPRP